MKFNTQSAEWVSIRIITCIISLSLFLLYNMCSKYDNGKKYLKSNSIDGLVCRCSNIFLQNELAV